MKRKRRAAGKAYLLPLGVSIITLLFDWVHFGSSYLMGLAIAIDTSQSIRRQRHVDEGWVKTDRRVLLLSVPNSRVGARNPRRHGFNFRRRSAAHGSDEAATPDLIRLSTFRRVTDDHFPCRFRIFGSASTLRGGELARGRAFFVGLFADA